MLNVFEQDDSGVTVSLPIAEDEKSFVTNGKNGKWRYFTSDNIFVT